ncbi:hypothetical protein phiV208_27 [Vibrio phage phiV208]|nr:hypothetical protein phiV208_27 [Vibrio phage phiV208]
MKNADMPAMPTADIDLIAERKGGLDESGRYALSRGVTKREMFAMHAMQGELAGSANHSRPDPEDVAHFAVKCADALLKELDK